MKVTMQHKDSSLTKEAPVGFSWTTFFFGVFVPLIRGDLKWAAILFVLGVLAGILSGGWLSFVPGFIMSFTYNSIYLKGLLEKGYKPLKNVDMDILVNKNILPSNPNISIEFTTGESQQTNVSSLPSPGEANSSSEEDTEELTGA